jgi:hypothetical protein
MATIRRHPVPADSFVPNRPLNDLLQAQLEHFREIEKRLPRPVQPTLNPDMPLPSHKDARASNHYIATMTTLMRERAGDPPAKRSPILVTKPAARSPQSAGLAIAASDPSPASPELAAKPTKAAATNKNAGTNKQKRRKP